MTSPGRRPTLATMHGAPAPALLKIELRSGISYVLPSENRAQCQTPRENEPQQRAFLLDVQLRRPVFH